MSLAALSISACFASFQTSPRQYGAIVNRALVQVSSDLRFKLEGCGREEPHECRFSSQHVTARVTGLSQPPRIDRIILEADILQDSPSADPASVITDVVLALGAAVITFDPRVPAKQRVRLLSDLTNTALDTGNSEATGDDARYSATFDDAADGVLSITIVPKS